MAAKKTKQRRERRHFTADQKSRWVKKARASALSLNAFAMNHGIAPNGLSSWIRAADESDANTTQPTEPKRDGRSTRREFTDAQKASAVRRVRESGLSLNKVAAEFGVALSVLRRWTFKADASDGQTTPVRSGGRVYTDKEKADAVAVALASNLPEERVAAELRIPTSSLHRWIRKATGVEIENGAAPKIDPTLVIPNSSTPLPDRDPGLTSSEREELFRLRRDVVRLTKDLDGMTNAARLFAKERIRD